MDAFQLTLALQAMASVFMAGVIAFVQVVHYPLFARVPAPEFPAYAREHALRTGRVVVLPMLIEAACALFLVFLSFRPPGTGQSPESSFRVLALIGLGLVLSIWLSTFLLQVPCHRRLAKERSTDLIRRLVRGNWLRSVAWFLRAALAVYWLAAVNSNRPG